MTRAQDVQQDRQHVPLQALAARAAGLALLLVTAPAAAADASERTVSGHRWIAPTWLSAPATSMLAVTGIGGLAAHLFRRRRGDRQRPRPTSQRASQADDQAADDSETDDWRRRLAMWEQRLGGDRRARERDDKDDSSDGPAPSR